MTKNFELRLIDGPAPDGEIAVSELNALSAALQELTTRIGRLVVDTPGPGRTRQFMEEFAQLRLSGVDRGSTVLAFTRGALEKLDVELEEQERADDLFWQLVESVRDDDRPEWVTDLIAESAGKLVDALKSAAPRAVFGRPSHAEIAIDSAAVHSETWAPVRVVADSEVTATGRLEKVDLHSHSFRVRDDVGNAVELRNVENDEHAARLVGLWVRARGTGTLTGRGRLTAIDDAVIESVEDPGAAYLDGSVVGVDELLATRPGPGASAGVELTDEEFAEFLEAARS